jgi:hypothetical protein
VSACSHLRCFRSLGVTQALKTHDKNLDDLLHRAEEDKPLAGYCHHVWQTQESPFLIAQLCQICKLFRYKISLTSDWEYRAPIPVARLPAK